MIQIAIRDLNHLLQTYGYLAVFVFVAVVFSDLWQDAQNWNGATIVLARSCDLP